MMLEPENSVYGEKSQIRKYYGIVNVKISIFYKSLKKEYCRSNYVRSFLAHESYDI